MARTPFRNRLAVDIGGTFTDVVLACSRGLVTSKCLTTHDDPSRAVFSGIDDVLANATIRPGQIDLVVHGTTLATNAIIERRGARTAFLTTEGHRDVLEMAHENRFEQYDVDIDRPRPLVPREWRFPIPERIDARGRVLRPLDEHAVARLIPRLDAEAIQSVAIGFLHGYRNGAHEHRVAEMLHAARPQLSLTLASEVCPEIREFERFSTAVANAYVRPLMARYLDALAATLAARGFHCPCLLMTSGGGLTTLATGAAFPIRLVESGPAGGAILAAHLARSLELDRVVSFDMGGTTAKLCLIDDGEPLYARAFEVDRTYRFHKGSGLPVRIPVIEMVEIGAGGGSIARVDALGRIAVGPESAGSSPGPACYGGGSAAATVTDADVQLGRIDVERFAGGRLPLDAGAAERALAAGVAAPLAITCEEAARAVAEVVDENMAMAARAHAVEWGKDTRGRTLIAFGGAAPLHAARLADKLGIDRIVIPRDAGVGSAVGFLLAPVAYEVVRSRHTLLSALDAAELDAVLREMRDEAHSIVRAAAVAGTAFTEARRAYMRYVGQGYEIAVTMPRDASADALRTAFDTAYVALYGRLIPGLDVEVLSWTLTLSAPPEEAALPHAPAPPPGRARAPDSHAVDRAALQDGMRVTGPTRIVEDQTTTVVPAGFTVRVVADRHLLLERSAAT